MSDALTHNERLSYEERILALEMDIERLAKGERPIYADAAKLEARAREVLQADAHGRGWHVAARHDEDAIVNIGTAVSAMMTLAREVATPKPPTGCDAIPAKEAFDAWRRAQPSGDERFPYDIAKAAFLAGRESATPKPPAGGDAGADAADILDHYARFIRDEVKADDFERHPYLPHIEQVAADLRAALALPAPVVEGDAFLAQLRRVNTDRYQAWVGDGEDGGLLFDATELGGEVGELLNVVKKLDREQRGWRGSRAGSDDFADECADVLICLDKLARRGGVDLEAATIRKFNATSEKHDFPHRLSEGHPDA